MKMFLGLAALLAASAAHSFQPCTISINEHGQTVTCCSQADGSQCCSDSVDDKGAPVGCAC